MSLPKIIHSQTSTSLEWSITGVRTRNQDDRDIIVYLDWVLLATRLDTTDKPVSALRSGTIKLDYNPANFVDFNSLTQTKLINWVSRSLGADKFKSLRQELEVEIDVLMLTEQPIPA